jgi:gas vesicle protein
MARSQDDESVVVVERGGSSIGPFLAGLAIGAGLALLFAPQSGEETRAQIRRGARRARRAAGDLAESVQEKAEDVWSSAKEQVEDGMETVKHAVDVKKKQAARVVDAGRDAAKQARVELERRLADAASGDRER